MAKASRGIGGTYTLTYLASVRYSWGVRQVNVIAAQRSPDRFFYRETPSLEVSSPGGPAASHSYEVFVLGRPSSRPGAGLYSCRQALPGSRWACRGPFTGIGMGGTNELLGPYPPQALVIGLQNAVVVYEAREPTRPATRRKPAFLFTRRVAGQNLRCLAFGPIPRPLGEACLDRSGIIAYYRLPQSFTYGAYDTVTLLAYSPRTVAASFKLPASVARVRPSAP